MNSSDLEIISEARKVAAEIEDLLRGRTPACAYLAIGMVLGAIQAEADKPDVEGLLDILRKIIGEQIGHGQH